MKRLSAVIALLAAACGAGDQTGAEYDGRAGLLLEAPGAYGPEVPAAQFSPEDANREIGSVQQAQSGDICGMPGATTNCQVASNAMSTTMWQGWQTNRTSRPTFLDIGMAESYRITGACGVAGSSGQGCLLPRARDQKSEWTWRWDRNMCAFLDSGVQGSYSGTAFRDASREVMRKIANATGLTMREVTSGEDITIFCDAYATSVFDSDDNTGAAWFPFGSTATVGANAISRDDRGCVPSISATTFRPTPMWTYRSAGISLNQDTMGNPRDPNGWANPSVCSGATDPNRPNFMFNVFHNVLLHEMMHHFGFGHFAGIAFMKEALPCATGNSAASIPSNFASAIAQSRLTRCIGADYCNHVWRVDRDLECGFPNAANDETNVGVE